MSHPMVDQVRFARSEFVRSLEGVTNEEAIQRFGSMNSIGWIIGHMANQEQRFWFERRGESILIPELDDLVGFGKPASTPPLDEMWSAWRTITDASNPFLDTLTTDDLQTFYTANGVPSPDSVGTMMMRQIDHYWFHNGEAQAIRQLLGHINLPQFVGNIGQEAPYRPE